MISLQTHDEGSRRPSITLIALVVVLLVVVGVVIERMLVSEEERIDAVVDALIVAIETEDRAGVDALLLDPFDYSGPVPIRTGEREALFVGLRGLWDVADDIDYVDGSEEIRIAKNSASHTSEGLVRFKWSESLVVHRAKIEVTLIRGAPGVEDDDAWRVRRIDVLELRRGLF